MSQIAVERTQKKEELEKEIQEKLERAEEYRDKHLEQVKAQAGEHHKQVELTAAEIAEKKACGEYKEIDINAELAAESAAK